MRTKAMDPDARRMQKSHISRFTGMPSGAVQQAFDRYAGVAAFTNCNVLVEFCSEYDTKGEEFERTGFLILPTKTPGLYAVALPLDWLFVAKQGHPTILITYQGVDRGVVMLPDGLVRTWSLQLFCRYTSITKKLSNGSLVVAVWDNQRQRDLWQIPAFFNVAQAEGLLDSRYPDWKKPWMYWEEIKNEQSDHRGHGRDDAQTSAEDG